MQTLQKKIILPALKGKSLFTKSCLLSNFQEKPKSLQKFKIKQAKFQKEDGRPVFLKMGFRDKILFNITWVSVVGGILYAFYVLHQFDLKLR